MDKYRQVSVFETFINKKNQLYGFSLGGELADGHCQSHENVSVTCEHQIKRLPAAGLTSVLMMISLVLIVGLDCSNFM
jgi:hypothetical protein